MTDRRPAIDSFPWLIFVALALAGALLWGMLRLPELTYIDLSVNRKQALDIATRYVAANEPQLGTYRHAIVFQRDTQTSGYLKRSIGTKKMKEFLRKYDVDLFYWSVRFFREGQKEQYKVLVSSRTGKVIFYQHQIEETERIEEIPKDGARERSNDFLHERFGFQIENYTLVGDLSTIYDFRRDHTFAWRHNQVSIPWKDGGGTGKLLSNITSSGDQILSYAHHHFKIPEDYQRDIQSKQVVSQNINAVTRIFHMIFIISAVYFVVARKNHLAMTTTMCMYIKIAAVLFALNMLGFFNAFESIITQYHTTSSMNSYVIRFLTNALVGTVMAAFYVLMPGLSGELLHFEMARSQREGSLLKYIHTTFFSREVAKSVLAGYLVFLVLLGCQALLLETGERFFSVWVEYSWMTSLSTSYFPCLAAITLGLNASVSEEVLYRLFGINVGKKFFKNTAAAVVISSLLWGFAHTTYPIYPMWYRAVEVSILGFFMAFIYLRFGLICTIVSHYVFNVFWHSTGYLFGSAHIVYLAGALFALSLPMLFAVIAFILNRRVDERPLRWHLNKQQAFNVTVLTAYLQAQAARFQGRPAAEIKSEIAANGWDFAVVEVAVDEFLGREASP